MVRSWILGSLSKELPETFIYCSTAQILQEELKERFGEGNGQHIYKIQREISSIQQGNNNLAAYFKKLWDDLSRLRPFPSCECGNCRCGLSKKLPDTDSSMKTVQFLMGLNEGFEAAKNQVLMQDPLPNTNIVYSMLQNVESQKTICKNFEETLEASAMDLKTQNNIRSKNFKKKDPERKEDRYCDHCKVQGHLKENCFKINGYPYWYVELLKTKKEKKNTRQVCQP